MSLTSGLRRVVKNNGFRHEALNIPQTRRSKFLGYNLYNGGDDAPICAGIGPQSTCILAPCSRTLSGYLISSNFAMSAIAVSNCRSAVEGNSALKASQIGTGQGRSFCGAGRAEQDASFWWFPLGSLSGSINLWPNLLSSANEYFRDKPAFKTFQVHDDRDYHTLALTLPLPTRPIERPRNIARQAS